MIAQAPIGRRVISGVMSGVLLTAVSVFSGLIQFRLILNCLPKPLAGIWFLFLSLGAYIAFFDLGISPTVSRELGFVQGNAALGRQERDTLAGELFATCLRVFQILAGVIFLFGILLGGVFLWRVTPAESFVEVGTAWCIFVCGAALNIIGGAWFATLYGLGYVATERALRAAAQILGLILTATMLYLGAGIIGLSVAWALQGLTIRVAGWVSLHRSHPEIASLRGRVNKTLMKKIALPSLKLAATGLGALLILQTDNVVIASVIGPSAIPPYEAVAKLTYHFFGLSMLIISSSTPFLSQFFAAGDMEKLRELTMKNVRYSMSFMVLVVTFLACFGDRVINLWLGSGNFVGFPVLLAFLVMLTLEVHHNILASATMATGRVVFHWVALGAGVLNLVMTLALVGRFGLLGVALGTLLAQLMTNNWFVPFISLKYLGIPFPEYLKKAVFPVSLLLVFALASNRVIQHAVSPLPETAGLALACVLSILFGCTMAWSIVLNVQERREVAALFFSRRVSP